MNPGHITHITHHTCVPLLFTLSLDPDSASLCVKACHANSHPIPTTSSWERDTIHSSFIVMSPISALLNCHHPITLRLINWSQLFINPTRSLTRTLSLSSFSVPSTERGRESTFHHLEHSFHLEHSSHSLLPPPSENADNSLHAHGHGPLVLAVPLSSGTSKEHAEKREHVISLLHPAVAINPVKAAPNRASRGHEWSRGLPAYLPTCLPGLPFGANGLVLCVVRRNENAICKTVTFCCPDLLFLPLSLLEHQTEIQPLFSFLVCGFRPSKTGLCCPDRFPHE